MNFWLWLQGAPRGFDKLWVHMGGALSINRDHLNCFYYYEKKQPWLHLTCSKHKEQVLFCLQV